MALYAFDGTWNEDEEGFEADTNVRKFLDFYEWPEEHENYIAGVGTRKRVFGKIAGGLTGAGGRTRIKEMLEEFEESYKAGDTLVDIIGFSRGAALALHFANYISRREFENGQGGKEFPRVRFLGLWDVVASFGVPVSVLIPFQKINLGWKLGVPERVDACYHAMAIHERRQTFDVTRLDPDNGSERVHEVWFRGVHSDIGGGNGNIARSNIALQWMLEQAINCGLPIDLQKTATLSKAIDPGARIKWPADPVKSGSRKRFASDVYHETALPRRLAVSRSVTVQVQAREKFNWTGIITRPGDAYSFEIDNDARWEDKEITCGADGWLIDEQEEMNSIVKWFIRNAEDDRRVAEANWFELCGTVGEDEANHFRVGCGCGADSPWVCRQSGPLLLFANDLKSKYGNNSGEIEVRITRTA